MKKNAFTFWEAVVVLVIMAILAAILYPTFHRGHSGEYSRRSNCQSHLRQIAFGLFQYQRDSSAKFPPVALGGRGWMDRLQPYLKNKQLFQCPSDSIGKALGNTDYFYNARLSGQPDSKMESIPNTIMAGDGFGESATNSSLTQLPSGWVSDLKSPANRHLEGANYAFADGHAKWLKPAKVTNEKPSSSVYTFAPW